MTRAVAVLLCILAMLATASACHLTTHAPRFEHDSRTDDTETSTQASSEGSSTGDGDQEPIAPFDRRVTVYLDGVPAPDAWVIQGGTQTRWPTGVDGSVIITFDTSIRGDLHLIAHHGRSRVGLPNVLKIRPEDDRPLEIHLVSIVPGDNEAYLFKDPGTPEDNKDATKCSHCHITINEDWYASPHRTAASNPVVQDVYAGVSSHIIDPDQCEAQGGRWWLGLEPGTGAPKAKCYLGSGTLPDLNPDCGRDGPCDAVAEVFGACADCHAPGIDGVVGGRSLLDATGTAYEYGVHCDVCHKVESVDITDEAGVAGRLRIQRPMEPAVGVDPWLPLTFGPYADVSNALMGAAPREHYREATFCAGCHQLDQLVLLPGVFIDTNRWPSGRIPVHSTYEEWVQGPLNPAAPCTSCHMPPDTDVTNGADLQVLEQTPDMSSGWERPPGAVRAHQWIGPRQPESKMLELAAAVFIAKEVVNGELLASVTVRNAGPGHALPTGEPFRSMVLRVSASCGEQTLPATGGDAIPDLGGYLAAKQAGDDWNRWDGARVGDVVRVIQTPGGWYDYEGFGPFGDGRFSAQEKGMPIENTVGESTVVGVSDGVLAFDRPLPSGDRAYLGTGNKLTPSDTPAAVAGAPGFAFARVLADPEGNRMVPHHRATDVVSDNRLLPQREWTSNHRFASPCAEPTVRAVLLYRPYPLNLARSRGWSLTETVMVDVSR